MLKIPAVGTESFKRLSFKEQISIAALKIFEPLEYKEKTGTSLKPLQFQYPVQNSIIIEEFPIAFLHSYWAGYRCSFQEKWYTGEGIYSPLEEFGIQHGYLINMSIFNFSFLAVSPDIHQVFSEKILSTRYDGSPDILLLDMCKYLIHEILNLPVEDFNSFSTFEEINGYYPVIEPCEELSSVEWREFVILNRGKLHREFKRYLYPLIPAEFYLSRKFSIKDWGFIDKL